MSNGPFFSSDAHHYHKNVIEFCGRPWTPETQTEQLIERWNAKVGLMDDVYHLGDFAFANHKKLNGVVDIINQLNGKIHFIKGNHCYPRLWQDIEALNLPHVEFVKDYHEISVDGIKVCMFHFPIASWNSMHHGSFHLYGHSHGSFQGAGKCMDVGVDCHPNKEPFSWEEVKDFMRTREIAVIDHHKEGAR